MSEIDFNKIGDFTIGAFNIYPSKNLIVEASDQIKVTPKVLAVLITLAKRKGETVSKDELMQSVWGDIATTDMVLSKAISDLRKALGDTGQKQQTIETVSKKGYALIKEVTWIDSDSKVAAKNYSALGKSPKLISAGLALGFIGFIIAIIYGEYFNKPSVGFAKAPIINNITADSREQRHPRFSPDGKFVAYFEYSENKSDRLILQDLQSGIKKELKSFSQKTKEGPSKGISFSGNGEKLAIRVNYKNECQITIIKLRSMVERKLNSCPSSTIASIDFSPDGNSIVTTELIYDRGIVNLVEIDLKTNKIKLAGEELEQSGGFLFPRFNKKGDKLASISIVAATASWSLVITELKTGKHRTVYQSERQLNQVVWGENDQVLYFVSHQGTAPGIWRLSLDTLAVTRVLNNSHEIIDLDYSEASGNFVYSVRQYYYEIVQKVLTEQGEYRDSPLQLATRNNIIPKISPDGSLLAYVSRDFGPDRLFVNSIDGHETNLLYSGAPGRIVDISWSPDSEKLMATQVNGDTSGIVLIDLKTGEIVDMGSRGKISRGKWSDDGTEVYWLSFDSIQWDLMKLGSDNVVSKIAELGQISDYDVIENGQIIVRRISLTDETKLELIIDSKINNQVEKTNLLLSHRLLGDWVINGDKIFYLIVNKKESSLFSMDFNGASNKKIASFKGQVFTAGKILSMSSDRRKVFSVLKNKIGNDLFLMSNE